LASEVGIRSSGARPERIIPEGATPARRRDEHHDDRHRDEVVDASDVRPALERALASELPAVVDVVTRFVPHPALPRFAAMGS